MEQVKKFLSLILCVLLLTGCATGYVEPTTSTTPTNTPIVQTISVDEDGVYDDKDHVALYIVTFDSLPSNYMSKKEARKHGWNGGALSTVLEGMCIGGDYYGNYEGTLPEDDEYHECDIDTLGKKKRGAKRIIYSDDGDVYYTEDHYDSFVQLYSEGNPS